LSHQNIDQLSYFRDHCHSEQARRKERIEGIVLAASNQVHRWSGWLHMQRVHSLADSAFLDKHNFEHFTVLDVSDSVLCGRREHQSQRAHKHDRLFLRRYYPFFGKEK
jgi:hypothetical protein